MRIDQIKIDEWYDIPGYGGKYQINYYGNIRRAEPTAWPEKGA